MFSMILGIGFVVGWMCMRLVESMPELGSVMSHYTWGVLLVLIFGLTLSMTPVRGLEFEGASTVGYGGLYLLVATMGAGGDLRAVAEAPVAVEKKKESVGNLC